MLGGCLSNARKQTPTSLETKIKNHKPTKNKTIYRYSIIVITPLSYGDNSGAIPDIGTNLVNSNTKQTNKKLKKLKKVLEYENNKV